MRIKVPRRFYLAVSLLEKKEILLILYVSKDIMVCLPHFKTLNIYPILNNKINDFSIGDAFSEKSLFFIQSEPIPTLSSLENSVLEFLINRQIYINNYTQYINNVHLIN